jgi:hypothetical protein
MKNEFAESENGNIDIFIEKQWDIDQMLLAKVNPFRVGPPLRCFE